MPGLLLLYGRRVAVALLGVDVYDGGVGRVFDAAEDVDQRGQVVAVFEVVIVEAEGLEEVQFGLSVRLTQQAQIGVESAVILGDAHLVVVNDDDDVRAQCGGRVEPLERLAAAEAAVADDGDDVLRAAQHIAALLQSGGQRDGGGGVSDLEVVVLRRFDRGAVARDGTRVGVVEEAVGAAGEDLVRIRLMGDVEDELVRGRVEDVMQGHGGLGEAQVRSDVSAVAADAVQYGVAHFVGDDFQLADLQFTQVGRGVDLFYVHIFYAPLAR